MPPRHTAYYVILFTALPFITSAQQKAHGKIYNEKGDEVLVAVTVRNISNRQFEVSDLGGNYLIKAKEGDTVVFSSATYYPDTVVINFFMLNAGHDVSMQPKTKTLATVTVRNLTGYQVDSLDRYEYYHDFYSEPIRKLAAGNGNAPQDGFGITFSPVTYFSTKEKQKRKLRERLQYDEQQYYIDFKFAVEDVATITHLQGDSLRKFMLIYRPTYKFCRKSTPETMKQYIHTSFKEYMKK
jgi:hypothetical protein